MLDLAWCGGLTEGRKIAALAEAYAKPLAPHDCTGPVTLMAGLHLALHAPTAIFQEVVRATLATWYRELVTDLPVIRDGMAAAPTAPGLGTRCSPRSIGAATSASGRAARREPRDRHADASASGFEATQTKSTRPIDRPGDTHEEGIAARYSRHRDGARSARRRRPGRRRR